MSYVYANKAAPLDEPSTPPGYPSTGDGPVSNPETGTEPIITEGIVGTDVGSPAAPGEEGYIDPGQPGEGDGTTWDEVLDPGDTGATTNPASPWWELPDVPLPDWIPATDPNTGDPVDLNGLGVPMNLTDFPDYPADYAPSGLFPQGPWSPSVHVHDNPDAGTAGEPPEISYQHEDTPEDSEFPGEATVTGSTLTGKPRLSAYGPSTITDAPFTIGLNIRDQTLTNISLLRGHWFNIMATRQPTIPAATGWTASTAYTEGQTLKPTANAGGHIYRCSTGGTSGAAAPTWTQTLSAIVVDGTARWTCENEIVKFKAMDVAATHKYYNVWVDRLTARVGNLSAGYWNLERDIKVQVTTSMIGETIRISFGLAKDIPPLVAFVNVVVANGLSFEVTIGTNPVVRTVNFTTTIQAQTLWGATTSTPINDTSYVPATTVTLTGNGNTGDVIAPTSTDATGWTSGAKDVECALTGGTGNGTLNITVSDALPSRTGTGWVACEDAAPSGYFAVCGAQVAGTGGTFTFRVVAKNADKTVNTTYADICTVTLTGGGSIDITSIAGGAWSSGVYTATKTYTGPGTAGARTILVYESATPAIAGTASLVVGAGAVIGDYGVGTMRGDDFTTGAWDTSAGWIAKWANTLAQAPASAAAPAFGNIGRGSGYTWIGHSPTFRAFVCRSASVLDTTGMVEGNRLFIKLYRCPRYAKNNGKYWDVPLQSLQICLGTWLTDFPVPSDYASVGAQVMSIPLDELGSTVPTTNGGVTMANTGGQYTWLEIPQSAIVFGGSTKLVFKLADDENVTVPNYGTDGYVPTGSSPLHYNGVHVAAFVYI